MLEGRDGFNEFDRWVCVTRSLGAVRNVAEQVSRTGMSNKSVKFLSSIAPSSPSHARIEGDYLIVRKSCNIG